MTNSLLVEEQVQFLFSFWLIVTINHKGELCQEYEEGTWIQELEQRACICTEYWLLLRCLLYYLSHTARAHLLRDDCSQWGTPSLIS